MKKRLTIFIIVLAVLFLAALFTASPSTSNETAHAASDAFLLLFAITALYGILSLIFLRVFRNRAEITLAAPATVNCGEPIAVTLQGRIASLFMTVPALTKLKISNLLTDETLTQPIDLLLKPRRSSEREFTFSESNCGKILLSIEKYTLRDPLGIFETTASPRDKGKSSAEVLIMPELAALDISEVLHERYDPASFRYSSVQSGSDPTEVFGLREYRPGDSLKQIHWKLTAKTNDVTIRIPSEPVENRICVLFFNSDGADQDDIRPEPLTPEMKSALATLALSVSTALSIQGEPHFVCLYDKKARLFPVFPVTNEEELWEMATTLLGAGFADPGGTDLSGLIDTAEQNNFSDYYLVAADAGPIPELLAEYGSVAIFEQP